MTVDRSVAAPVTPVRRSGRYGGTLFVIAASVRRSRAQKYIAMSLYEGVHVPCPPAKLQFALRPLETQSLEPLR